MSTYAESPYVYIASLALNAMPATLATAALLLLMHSLIATDMDPPEVQERRDFEVIFEVPVITEIPPTELPDKPPEVAKEPVRMEAELIAHTDDFGGQWNRNALPQVAVKGPITAGTNMVVPYLRLQPEYPARALKRGLEGYVDLAFDITAAGATSNIRVVEAQPEGVFERAAIRALEKWKYRVPITDGVPQGQVDMMTRLTFEIED